MRRVNKIIITVIFIAVLLLGTGYATIQNITLEITGTATATATLEKLTNENIGDYIDLGNDIVGTEETTDDWRVLYVDDNNVYAILADYLPNSTGYAANAGLITSSTYSVYSDAMGATLKNRLTTSSYWSGLANGISGAIATGTPTYELLISSYNAKNGTTLDSGVTQTLDKSTEDYDLYVPRTTYIDSCFGYWLATQSGSSNYLFRVGYNGYIYNYVYNSDENAVRPIVALPASITATQIGDIWTIVQ